MQHEIETNWMGKMQFDALVNGHVYVMDAPSRVGGEDKGSIPKPFVLTALSGCTGMDVVKLLDKSGRKLKTFSLKVSGTISSQPPIEYTDIHVVYDMSGSEDDLNPALGAVMLSQEKICGVSAMLKRIIPVTWQVIYNGKEVYCSKRQNDLAVP